MATSDIVVVGSANLDLVVAVERHPRTGETVMGGDLQTVPGGKGANQATAAARLGRATSFVGLVGADDAGRQLRESLAGAGVDTTHLGVADGVPTGTALITVDSTGDNAIVVSPGANRLVDRGVVTGAATAFDDTALTLLQLEVPLDAVAAAAETARGLVVLNPAPAPSALPQDLLQSVDVLVPNETELATLTGVAPTASVDDLAAAARTTGVERVIVTLGARGALLVTARRHLVVPAPHVQPVDTTAAGDAFCAALADQLLEDDDLEAAVGWAVRAGAATTLRSGAASSLPSRDEVDQRLDEAVA